VLRYHVALPAPYDGPVVPVPLPPPDGPVAPVGPVVPPAPVGQVSRGLGMAQTSSPIPGAVGYDSLLYRPRPMTKDTECYGIM